MTSAPATSAPLIPAPLTHAPPASPPPSPLRETIAQYRSLPALTGRAFLPMAFLARLPVSMTQIGTVVLVSSTFHSIGAGGVTAGFLAAGAAAGGPLVGQLADRIGQRGVLLTASLLNATSTLVLVALVIGRASMPAIYGAALVAGASIPQIGSMVRARWVRITRGGPQLAPAMSYEGAADEAAYVLGPAAVSLMSALASPALAMVTAALLVGVFGSAVALHPTATAAPAGRPGGGRLHRPRVLALVLGTMAIGCFFGGMQTGVAGVATAAGVAGAAGGIYAIMGVGSAITGLSCAAIPSRFSLPGRLVFFASMMVLGSLPLLFLTGLPAVIVVLVPLGCAVGPYLITLFSMAEREVSAGQAARVMTLLSSGLVVGYALGSSVGGALADSAAASAPFAVAAGAMVIGTGIAVLLRRRPARA